MRSEKRIWKPLSFLKTRILHGDMGAVVGVIGGLGEPGAIGLKSTENCLVREEG